MGGGVQLLVGSLLCSNQGRVSPLYQPGVSMVRQFQGVQGHILFPQDLVQLCLKGAGQATFIWRGSCKELVVFISNTQIR